ncbi:ANTAR domain-containing protein [Streptomyces iconiensis]|uniref:ANTAR domain-containing protein n=1 Tax=Streptomyces iconiensis TaxID=1384038 RepID=A0ABT6ZR49_9ACTN|nr:ANTAR domain-containing protein [Streptomyces iconiensis]MDJ1131540.1 ANTAR domain-containing protein [Streptomyces iconiensis]
MGSPEPSPAAEGEQPQPGTAAEHGSGGSGQPAEVDRLRAEVTDLRRAMETHPVIDQARGMVMALGPCTADEAWEVLVEVSQSTNVKLREVAADLVATPEGEELPAPIRRAMATSLKRRRTGLD